MDILRRAANPWGQEVLLGIGWDLFWWAVAGGFAFVLVHTLLVKRLAARGEAGKGAAGAGASSAAVPAKVTRHTLASRLFHWAMAASMLVLLITAFVPVVGFQFDWVTIHWIAGLVLTAAIVYHIVHAVFFQNLWSIWVSAKDMREGIAEMLHLLGRGGRAPGPTAKYPVANKLYHHGAAAAGIAAIATGLFMMVRIDTPLFTQNQYMLGDGTWGMVYVLHGLAGVGLVLMVITHIYMAVRPEKWWQTRSMIKGWITREEYLSHHDPALWPVDGTAPARESLEPVTVGAEQGERLQGAGAGEHA